MTLELHPLCTLFPRMTGPDFDALLVDVAENGLREPIVLHDGMILDGGNRYRACLTAGVEPRFREFDGENIVSFVLSANLHRRHLTPGQQAAIVASATDWARAHAAGSNQYAHKARGPATLPDLSTVADRAAMAGASERTQRMADKVARESPGLAREVAAGNVSLPAAVEAIKAGELSVNQAIAPKPAAPKVSEADTLKARIAELEQALTEARDAAADAGALAQDLLMQIEGEADKRLEQLRAELKATQVTRDIALRENAALKREVKRLQRQIGVAQ